MNDLGPGICLLADGVIDLMEFVDEHSDEEQTVCDLLAAAIVIAHKIGVEDEKFISWAETAVAVRTIVFGTNP